MEYTFVKGSVFDFEKMDLDVVIIFVPCGLTFLRHDTESFIKEELVLLKDFKLFELYQLNTGERKFVVVHRNMDNELIEPDFALDMLRKIFYLLSRNGMKRIGMNGIRLKRYAQFPEQWLYDEVRSMLKVSVTSIEAITFIDLRGGFNKIVQ